MIITWYGHSCFKIVNTGGQLVIITDPFDKSIGLKPPRLSADIVTISHQHSDHNNVRAVAGQPFVVETPGEYEIKGVKIIGLDSFHDSRQGAERGGNIIYVLEVDKIKLCHLGDLGQEQLTDEQLESIGPVDILMIPVGGTYTIGSKEAARLVNQLEPKIVIPMHYQLPGLKIGLDSVEGFLKEMGLAKKAAVDKLTLKKKDLGNYQMEVVVMKP